MVATNAGLVFGGMTSCCFSCGLRMFFQRPPGARTAGVIQAGVARILREVGLLAFIEPALVDWNRARRV